MNHSSEPSVRLSSSSGSRDHARRVTPLASLHSLYSLDVEAAVPAHQCSDGPPCTVCGKDQWERRFVIRTSPFEIAVCAHCGLGMLQPEPTPDQLRQFYPDVYYGDDGSKFSVLIEPLVRWMGGRRSRFVARLMPAGGRILDVGCGRGILLKSLAVAGYQTHGFEAFASACAGVDPRVTVTVASTLADAGYPQESFDMVVLWHVLEHVVAPRETLQEVHRLLAPGGVIIVAVPNFSSLQARCTGAAWFHLDPPRHLFHFPLEGLKSLLQRTGFVVNSDHHFSLRQNPFGWIQSLQNKLRWLPRNGIYAMLHRHGADAGCLFSLSVRLQLWACLLLLLVPALAASVMSAALRTGATVHVVARKAGRDT